METKLNTNIATLKVFSAEINFWQLQGKALSLKVLSSIKHFY
tara:strand:+ start:2313 stop:2438 length:126 start_codon:yes stop_codon:yes gene_type:complete